NELSATAEQRTSAVLNVVGIRDLPGGRFQSDSCSLMAARSWKPSEPWREHAGYRGGVPDVLRGHPCVGLPPRLASAVVLPECADAASRDRGVQLHVSAARSK